MASNFWTDTLPGLDPIIFGPIAEGLGASREADAREAELGPSPTFNIPESYDFALNQLKKRQSQQMSGYESAMAGIQQDTAANLTGAGQLSSGPEAIMAQAGIYGDQAARVQDLGMRASQWRQQQQQRYAQALQGRGSLEQQQFEYNQFLPWQIQKNEIASLRAAGQGMQTSGSDTMAAAGIQGASMFNS